MAQRFDFPTWTHYYIAWANEEIDRELAYEEGVLSKGDPTYVIQCEGTGHVKIGTSNNPEGRLKILQIGSASRLQIIAILDVDERWAHDDLRPYRLHGEWFEWTPEVEAYVREHAA